MTDVNLELISDNDMYLFVEKGIRGGISYIAKKYSKVSNKNMKSYFDSKSNKYKAICMVRCSGFKWFNKKEQINRLDVNLISKNSLHGYILEVDLEYPKKLFIIISARKT